MHPKPFLSTTIDSIQTSGPSDTISHQVHRIGYHFPSFVVENACDKLGVSLSRSGHVLSNNGKTLTKAERQRFSTGKKHIRKFGSFFDNDTPQATLDIEAQAAIKDLFPKIPDRDVLEIISRAFQKVRIKPVPKSDCSNFQGKYRVGTAIELPLPRRVQLAVVAHVRHHYTDYDNLLKITDWPDARARIERPCLDVLAQWRRDDDDDDDDPDAMEEILREVIVLDDDEEDEENRNFPTSIHQSDRDDSVEIISSHVFANDVQSSTVDYSTPGTIMHRDQHHLLERDSREIAQDAGEQPRHYTYLIKNDIHKIDRMKVHQHRWQEALRSRRTNPAPAPIVYETPLLQEKSNHPRAQLLWGKAVKSLEGVDLSASQPDPLECDSYPQLQDHSHHQAFPLRLKDKLAEQETSIVSRGPKEVFTESGQVSTSTGKFESDGPPITH